MEKIDLTSFEKALNSLFEVIEIYNNNAADLIVRDSLIQRFEYTYSLSLKMIKRYFKNGAFVFENIESMTFNEMIRMANKMGLLNSNLEKWDVFRQKRNLTSHTYDEKIALDVALIVEDFAYDAQYLLNKLKEKKLMIFGLEKKYIDFIKEILKKNIKDCDVKFYIFGSRAKGKFNEYSDIDIAIEIKNKKLDESIKDKIQSEFDNSLFPYEIDIIDLNSIDEKFKNLIKDTLMELN